MVSGDWTDLSAIRKEPTVRQAQTCPQSDGIKIHPRQIDMNVVEEILDSVLDKRCKERTTAGSSQRKKLCASDQGK
jgi:hypothetical protein